MSKRRNRHMSGGSGSEPEVNELTALTVPKVLEGHASGEECMDFLVRMHVDYRLRNGIRKKVRIPVEIEFARYTDLSMGGGDIDDRYVSWKRGLSHCAYKIRVDMKGGKRVTAQGLADTVSHEFLHAKTLTRERLEHRTELSDIFIGYREDDSIGYVQYFLSDNEMSSYVQGMYSWCKAGSEKIMKKKGRKPTKAELTKMMKDCRSWRWLDDCVEMIREADNKTVEERLKTQDGMAKGRLGKMTGMKLTYDGFVRHYMDKAEHMRKKLVKAAYKGYRDINNI